MKRLVSAAIACGFAGAVAHAQDVLPPAAGAAWATPPPASAPPSAAPAAALPPPPFATAPREHQRGGWYIGFGLGSGGGSARIGNESYSFADLLGRSGTTGAINFRVGVTVTPKLLVGFDGGGVGAIASSPSEVFQLNYYDVGAMFFPWDHGAFVRAAAGRSVFAIDTDGPVLYGKGSYGGWNALGGIGYAFWLGKAFNLTLNLDYQAHFFSSSGAIDVSRGSAWSAWLGFDWY
jgi:hypothetical protein